MIPPAVYTAAAPDKTGFASHPLAEFYRKLGRPLPEIQVIAPSRIPEPGNRLLVHQRDMTPVLERYYRHPIHIQVYHRVRNAQRYFRAVLLRLDASDQPVEFGAIQIHLDRLPARARQLILAEHLPLGGILQSESVSHYSKPSHFIRLGADPFIATALEDRVGQPMFGRRNTLYSPEGVPIAEVLEILPSKTSPSPRETSRLP